MIKEFFAFISAPLTQWLKNYGEVKKAKHKRNIAVIKNQARLAQSKVDYNHEWEMANLQDKDKLLRFISFWLFTLPLLITVVSPETGKQIFTNLEFAPEWFVKTWVIITGAVWGVAELKNSMPQLIGQLSKIRGKNGTVAS